MSFPLVLYLVSSSSSFFLLLSFFSLNSSLVFFLLIDFSVCLLQSLYHRHHDLACFSHRFLFIPFLPLLSFLVKSLLRLTVVIFCFCPPPPSRVSLDSIVFLTFLISLPVLFSVIEMDDFSFPKELSLVADILEHTLIACL